ncbi:MAG TPA: DUF6701 domain-containing protein [Gammaproteobacteria bacterium]|nr:DUF6701 domain-containing protein [Gammaproteobacteria bacterium]
MPGIAKAQAPQYVNSWFTNAQGAEVLCVGLKTPPETVPGDLMLAVFTLADGTPNKVGLTSIAAPDGWALVSDSGGTVLDQNSTDSTGFGIRQAVYYHIATSSEPAQVADPDCSKLPGNYIWHFSNDNPANANKGIRIMAGIVVYHGVDAADPFDAVSSAAAVSSNSITAPSITTTSSNDMLVGIFGSASNVGNAGFTAPATMTSPTGYNDSADVVTVYNEQSGAGPNGVSQMLADELFAGPGPTGNRIATGIFSNEAVAGQMLAIRGSRLDHFVIEATGGGAIGQQTAGQSFDVRILAVDSSGNVVTGFSGSVNLTSTGTLSAGGGTTPAFSDGELDNYSVTISNTGTFALTVTASGDSTMTGVSNNFNVVAGAFDHLALVMPAATNAGAIFPVTVSAVDSNGNIVAGFNDVVALSSTDPDAILPPPTALVDGTATFSVALYSAPQQTTITTSDTTNSGVSPASGVITVNVLTSGFNAFDTDTPAGNTVGSIKTKIAGQPVSLDIISLANGNYNGTVTVELIGDNTGFPTGCPAGVVPAGTTDSTGWVGLQQWTFDFKAVSGNRATMPAFTETNAWREARILISDGNQTYCSNDLFAIRPDHLGLVQVQDATRTTTGTVNTLNVASVGNTHVHNAGRPFRIAATGMDVNGNVTSNYDGSPEPVLPLQPAIAGCSSCVPGTLDVGIWNASGGTVVTTTATYSEAGAFATRLVDKHFADIDLGDGSTEAQRYIYSGTLTIGRFVPDKFVATFTQAPRFATGCTAFTYLGQPFTFDTAPVITVTAQNAAGEPTMNYAAIKADPADPFGRLTSSSLSAANAGWPSAGAASGGYSETDNSAGGSHLLDLAAVPAINAITIVSISGSTATLTFPAGTTLDVEKISNGAGASGEPPFNADIDLSLYVTDADAVQTTTAPVLYADIPFSGGSEMRYGRVFMNTAVGSELLPLPVEMVAQYYKAADTGFVTNAADGCTTVTMPGTFAVNKGATETGSTTPTFTTAAAGSFGLVLSAPGEGHDGGADLTATVPSWLRFDWNGDGIYSDNPTSRATFGLYEGTPHRVYQQEVVGP